MTGRIRDAVGMASGSVKGRTRVVVVTLLVALMVVPLAGGCTPRDADDSGASATQAGQDSESAAFPVTVTDDAGREVTVVAKPERIVSLAPANTEILYALGIIDKVVGVTTFDDYPAEVADIEKVGDFVGPNLEAVTAAQPDLVLVTTGIQTDVIGRLEETGATVVAVDPQDMEGLYAAIEMVGVVTGEVDAAEDVVSGMRADLAEIATRLEGSELVSCFLEIAQEPLFTVGSGTLMDELITLAGGENVVAEEGYVAYSLEQLLQDDPAVYLATMGSMNDPSALEARAGYDKLSAVISGRVFVLEDNLVSRPGPRIIEGIEQIARALHPEAF